MSAVNQGTDALPFDTIGSPPCPHTIGGQESRHEIPHSVYYPLEEEDEDEASLSTQASLSGCETSPVFFIFPACQKAEWILRLFVWRFPSLSPSFCNCTVPRGQDHTMHQEAVSCAWCRGMITSGTTVTTHHFGCTWLALN